MLPTMDTNTLKKHSAQVTRVSGRILLLGCRTLIQILFYIWERCSDLVDLINHKLSGLLVEPEYIRTGQCKMTGQCCRAIGIEFPASWATHPRLISALARWHSLRYNFELVGRDENLMVYECRYLRSDNRCGIQYFKPKLCRDFPSKPWRGQIRLHKGCGYHYQHAKAIEFKIKLHGKADLSKKDYV